MLRPRVTHSAAHRNIRQKRPWMEYSGTTSWGGRVRGQLPSGRVPRTFKGTEGSQGLGGAPHRNLWGLKRPRASHSLPVADQRGPEGQGRTPGSQREGPTWDRSLLLLALTLTFLRRQQMRSMFFKRSRCRGRKRLAWGRRRSGHWGCPRCPPYIPRRPSSGRQGAPEQSLRQGSSRAVPMATVTMEGPSPASPRQRPRAWQRPPRQEEPEP